MLRQSLAVMPSTCGVGSSELPQGPFSRPLAVSICASGPSAVPGGVGSAYSKEARTNTIMHAANLLGVELVSPDGSERVSGHSLRATGAQGLATAGIDTWAIELLGRWGGDTARGYIREARLADASAMAKRVTESVPRGVSPHLGREARHSIPASLSGSGGS